MRDQLGKIIRDLMDKQQGEKKLEPYWKFILEKYKPKKRLGTGSSGEVILARNRATSELVAIKHIPVGDHDVMY